MHTDIHSYIHAFIHACITQTYIHTHKHRLDKKLIHHRTGGELNPVHAKPKKTKK